jgi:hypothetical protein
MRALFNIRTEVRIDQVDAVIFAIQAANARLTANQRHIFLRIQNMFGSTITTNLIVAATFADAGAPQVVASFQRQGIKYRQIFKFNNSALFKKNQLPKSDLDFSQLQWREGMESYHQCLLELSKIQSRVSVRGPECSPAMMQLYRLVDKYMSQPV